jgi:hypothetical protein
MNQDRIPLFQFKMMLRETIIEYDGKIKELEILTKQEPNNLNLFNRLDQLRISRNMLFESFNTIDRECYDCF